jgi:hypothetical protein
MPYKFIKELKIGDSGQEVTDLQNFINEIHFQNVLINGKQKTVTPDGDFGEITETAIASIKAKAYDYISTEYIKSKFKEITGKEVPNEWLEIDGIVNPLFGLFLERWYGVQEYLHSKMKGMELIPDEEPAGIRLIEDVIRLEKAEIGTREEHPYNNTGKRINEYIKIGSGGIYKNGGIAWCDAFQHWGLKIGCDNLELEMKIPFSVYTPFTVEDGKKKGIAILNPTKSQIKKGMWGFVHSKIRGNGIAWSSVQHIYLITGTKGNNILTIEGNTNSQGGSEGNGVYNRIRPLNKTQCWVVIEWSKLY